LGLNESLDGLGSRFSASARQMYQAGGLVAAVKAIDDFERFDEGRF